MKIGKWLQLFAGEGAGDGGSGAAAESGDTGAADAGQQLEALGVPKDKIRKRAMKAVPRAAQVSPAAHDDAGKEPNRVAAGEKNAEPAPPAAEKKLSWEEIMADPDYNRQMQSVVQARLKESRAAQDTLQKLSPALEIMAARYGMDPENVDYDALSKSIREDNRFYEQRAAELGVTEETARKIDEMEIWEKKRAAEEQKSIQQQMVQQHIQKLTVQGEALKKTFAEFDLREEMQNPAFSRLVSPGVGLSVEDAYYAVHRQEIQKAAVEEAARKAAEKVTASIQAAKARPVENGVSGQAASTSQMDYRSMSREQRENLKKEIRLAAARGEKIYPGQ